MWKDKPVKYEQERRKEELTDRYEVVNLLFLS